MLACTLLATACEQPSDAGTTSPPVTPEQLAAARESYDRYRRPEVLVAALNIEPGDLIADVGAGTGYLEPYLAAAGGRIVATDIDPWALAELRRHVGKHETWPGSAIETRVVFADDPGLEAGHYDLILLVQVDHLLPDRAAYLRRLKDALAPDGRIAISNRLTYRAKVLEAAKHAGLQGLDQSTDLPGQFLLVFTSSRGPE
jgi:SAM-dependent methyltransferase